MRLLLAAGAQLEAADQDGRTALMAAARQGRPENVRVLLAAGANSRRRDGQGRNGRQHARESGHWDLSEALPD